MPATSLDFFALACLALPVAGIVVAYVAGRLYGATVLARAYARVPEVVLASDLGHVAACDAARDVTPYVSDRYLTRDGRIVRA